MQDLNRQRVYTNSEVKINHQQKLLNNNYKDTQNKQDYFTSLLKIKNKIIYSSNISQQHGFQNSTKNSTYNNSLANKNNNFHLTPELSNQKIKTSHSQQNIMLQNYHQNRHINNFNNDNPNKSQIFTECNSQTKRLHSQNRGKKYLSLTQKQKKYINNDSFAKSNRSLIVTKHLSSDIKQQKNTLNHNLNMKNYNNSVIESNNINNDKIIKSNILVQRQKSQTKSKKPFFLTQNSANKYSNKKLHSQSNDKQKKQNYNNLQQQQKTSQKNVTTIQTLQNSIKKYFNNIINRITFQSYTEVSNIQQSSQNITSKHHHSQQKIISQNIFSSQKQMKLQQQFDPFHFQYQNDHIVMNQNIQYHQHQKIFKIIQKSKQQRQVINKKLLSTSKRTRTENIEPLKTRPSEQYYFQNNQTEDPLNKRKLTQMVKQTSQSIHIPNQSQIKYEYQSSYLNNQKDQIFQRIKEKTLTRIDSPVLGLLQLQEMESSFYHNKSNNNNKNNSIEHNYSQNVFSTANRQRSMLKRPHSELIQQNILINPTQQSVLIMMNNERRKAQYNPKNLSNQKIIHLPMPSSQNIQPSSNQINHPNNKNTKKKLKCINLIQKQQIYKYKKNKMNSNTQTLKQGYIKLKQIQKQKQQLN